MTFCNKEKLELFALPPIATHPLLSLYPLQHLPFRIFSRVWRAIRYPFPYFVVSFVVNFVEGQ